MAEIILSDIEKGCCVKLAERFEEGTPFYNADGFWNEIGLSDRNFFPVLSTLEQAGLIGNVMHTSETRFDIFEIKIGVVQVMRQLEEKKAKDREGRDIVESVKLTLRKHPVAGWLVVAAAAVVSLATAITQIGGALKMLGLVGGK